MTTLWGLTVVDMRGNLCNSCAPPCAPKVCTAVFSYHFFGGKIGQNGCVYQELQTQGVCFNFFVQMVPFMILGYTMQTGKLTFPFSVLFPQSMGINKINVTKDSREVGISHDTFFFKRKDIWFLFTVL